MQPQHSCGTLESRIKIFGCTVQELYITLYPLDHYPLLHRACALKRYPEPHGQVTAYNRSPVH